MSRAKLESILWPNGPVCSYCGSQKKTSIEGGERYRCNSCFTNYSVTVGTFMEKTHVDIAVWFAAVKHADLSDRDLAERIGVNKNTANLMKQKIRWAEGHQSDLIDKMKNCR